VDCDPQEPRREFRTAFELAQVLECSKIGLLQDVVCICLVPDDSSGRPIDPLIMPPNEKFKQAAISGKNTLHDLAVCQMTVSQLFQCS
jgi:hypothetical protein